jgi:alpha-glucosidase
MRLTAIFAAGFLLFEIGIARDVTVLSPDGRLRASIEVGKGLTLKVNDGPTELFAVASVSMSIRGERPFGQAPDVLHTERSSRDTTIQPTVREKYATLEEQYNEVALTFAGGFGLILRVFDEGIAYRFVTVLPGDIVVDSESFHLRLPETTKVAYQYQEDFWGPCEEPYRVTPLAEMPLNGFCNLPVLVSLPAGPKLLITEADIEDYPGLWLRHAGGGELRPSFAGYPLALLDEGKIYTRGKVTEHAPEIARTTGTRTFPWRVFIVARHDADLLTNSMVYLLGEPTHLNDVSWITPGVVTLDWWARRNLYGVDFVGGVNTVTAKYLIDFAAHYGLRYVLLDEGWTKDEDLLAIHPDLELDSVLSYAKAKGVHMLLWAVWSTLERQWDAAFENFSRWGISGIKVDFMNRDDQQMVDFYYRVAEETARRKLLVIFHGAYKPDGLRRTYPNALTREGLIEIEQNQVTGNATPDYDLLFPFIRMVAGPADYLPGSLMNAQKHEFRLLVPPMSQGTRAHAMAMCVVVESPIRMFPDSPADYYREDECTRFMAETPVEWDELRVLEAAVGDSLLLARRHGEEWYAAAITDWEPRTMEIDCSFLDAGKTYTLTAFRDGLNAQHRAIDYASTTSAVTRGDKIVLRLAPGGGWVGSFRPVQ